MPRVATYNTHDCIGIDGKYSPERIADVIMEMRADVVALQEITLDHAGDLADRLKKTTGMLTVDGTIFGRGLGRYGNVLLSRYAIREQRLHDLSFTGCEPRGVIDAMLMIDSCPLRVLATHLGLTTPERNDQLRRLADLLADDLHPTVLLGDFNVWWSSRPFVKLRNLGFIHTRIRTFPTWLFPMFPLDRIFVRTPAAILSCSRHHSFNSWIASDHFPVVVDMEIA
ncbi:MAG: endonuclease/exonuclease/phosphatase family protein [Gammaproteobacteria bacterium]|jgi:endonuclease/exonuclease/phosphatase family metal-dependent hydrolase|nr:endonuclease/exonuclease/phosphatase family protein [Gammaproteobacteria bacterium]